MTARSPSVTATRSCAAANPSPLPSAFSPTDERPGQQGNQPASRRGGGGAAARTGDILQSSGRVTGTDTIVTNPPEEAQACLSGLSSCGIRID